VADLTVELRAWPADTWAKLEVDPQAAAGAVIAAWRRAHLKGLQLGGLTEEEALALERPAMTYVREQLRDRLARQVGRASRRWLYPTSGRRPRRALPVTARLRQRTASCGSPPCAALAAGLRPSTWPRSCVQRTAKGDTGSGCRTPDPDTRHPTA
jgi:hypothetical protein